MEEATPGARRILGVYPFWRCNQGREGHGLDPPGFDREVEQEMASSLSLRGTLPYLGSGFEES